MRLFGDDSFDGLTEVQRKTAHLVGEAAAIAAMKLLENVYSQKDAADIGVDIENIVRKAVAKRMVRG